MNQVFDFQVPYYNFHSETSQFCKISQTHYGVKSARFLGPKIWTMVPQKIENWKFFLQEFKRLIKVSKPETCPCRMCKKCVANIGFI